MTSAERSVPLSAGLLATAASLAVDRVAADVVTGLDRRGVPSILLKGPSIVRFLYGDGVARPYGDVDLFVSRGSLDTAQETLVELGFRYGGEGDRPTPDLPGRLAWERGSALVDLHTNLVGCEVPDNEAWSVLHAHTEQLAVGGRELAVFDRKALALHVVLHAAQHGPSSPKALQDLTRLIDCADDRLLASALALARDLHAVEAFELGLRLDERGSVIAHGFGLATTPSRRARMRAAGAPAQAQAFEKLVEAAGAGRRLSFVRSRIFPSARYMRTWTPLARRGRGGLALAYAWRLVWLIGRAPGNAYTWLRTRGRRSG